VGADEGSGEARCRRKIMEYCDRSSYCKWLFILAIVNKHFFFLPHKHSKRTHPSSDQAKDLSHAMDPKH
jgi:hypothetical protein